MINESDVIWDNSRVEDGKNVIDLDENLEKYDMLSLFYHKKTVKIDSDETIGITKQEETQRYFDGYSCHTCGGTGHFYRDCEFQQKRNCAYCGRYHIGEACRLKFCNNCRFLGHSDERCRNKKFRNTQCKRCTIQLHSERECPWIWRQYKIKSYNVSDYFIMSCPICHGEDHFIDDCKYKEIKMSIFTKNYFDIIKKNK